MLILAGTGNFFNMRVKNIMIAAMGLAFSLQTMGQQKIFTTADYDFAASRLGANANQLVDRQQVRPQWLPDGSFWYKILTATGSEYVLVNAKNGSRKTAAKKETLLPAAADVATEAVRRPAGTQIVSPDEKKAVFIKNWNLWVKDIASGTETQLTTDGVKDYGYATNNAGWVHSDRPVVLWSPDSKKLVTFQQDQRHVKDMYLVRTTVGSPELEQWKYPLPGDEKIITIERVIIELDNPKVIRLDMPADARRSTLSDDITDGGSFADNQWSPDGKQLAFVSSSRDHKKATLRIADAVTGKVRDVFTETVATQYESGVRSINWRYLPASNEFLWYSERDNWGHLYLYDLTTGQLKQQITKGDYVVTKLLRVDEKKRLLYFEANGKEAGRNPYFTHLYKTGFDGKTVQLLTPEDGFHQISFSPDGQYFVDNYSQPSQPGAAVLRNSDGKQIAQLEKTDIARLTATGWHAPVSVQVKSASNAFELYGLMFTPTQLDANKKYPVINYIYPGPQGGGVGSWAFSAARSDHQALADLGFVVVVIEGSCNPGRSKAFHDACYGNMAENTLPDQIAGIKQLAAKYSFMDLERVGVWGHSGGGFATASAMFKYPEFYKVGISESGNHDNRNYEDDWGERYNGLLEKDAEGISNYQGQANQVYAKNLLGKLMLIHGGMDDNVPPYNTYLVVDALVKANKDFDLLVLPNARHGYADDSYYVMRRRWDYFIKNLQGNTPANGYKIAVGKDGRE